VKEILGHLLIKSEASVELVAAFKRQQKTKMPRVMRKAVCRVEANRLLKNRCTPAGNMLGHCSIKSQKNWWKGRFWWRLSYCFHRALLLRYSLQACQERLRFTHWQEWEVCSSKWNSAWRWKRRRETPYEMGVSVSLWQKQNLMLLFTSEQRLKTPCRRCNTP